MNPAASPLSLHPDRLLPAEPTQRAVVDVQPRELVLALRPDHGPEARVREGQMEGMERPRRALHPYGGKLRPVRLPLRARHRLDAPAGLAPAT